MQSFFTFAIESLFVVSAAHFALQFALGLRDRQSCPRVATPAAPVCSIVAPATPEVEAEVVADFTPNPNGFCQPTIEEAALVESHAAFVAQYWSEEEIWWSEDAAIVQPESLSLEIAYLLALPDSAFRPISEVELCDQIAALWQEATAEAPALLEVIETDDRVLEDYAALDPFKLRKECGKRGIKWRNAHGANKHLTKPQMIAALQSA